MAAPFTVTERRVRSCSVLRLSGKLVAEDGARIFANAVNDLIDRGVVQFVLDLRDVTTLDSGGVGVLVATYLRARRAGGDLKLVCPSSHACRVLAIAGLLKIFESFDNEERAVGSFDSLMASG
jgi:anti-anti-sigma factor